MLAHKLDLVALNASEQRDLKPVMISNAKVFELFHFHFNTLNLGTPGAQTTA